jgi:ribosomal protein S15P/S13E
MALRGKRRLLLTPQATSLHHHPKRNRKDAKAQSYAKKEI